MTAARIVQCPGSFQASRRYPREDTVAAREGAAAHWAFAQLLTGRQIDVGVIAPNDVVLTDEMVEGAEMLAADVAAARAESLPAAKLHVEELLKAPSPHVSESYRPDVWLFDRGRFVLYVWAYKFGHEYVSAYENYELIDYVAGILAAEEITGISDEQLTVRLRVVQPRSYHKDGPVREWRVLASDLRAYWNRLQMATDEALGTSPRCHVGPECKHCPARHACGALHAAALSACDVSTDSTPLELAPVALARELQMLRRYEKILKARVSGLESTAAAMLRSGTRVPGFALEQGYGRETWKSVDDAIALGEMMGVSVSKPGAITPKQAIKAGLPAELVREYSVTPPGEVKLAETGDRLAAVFGRAAS